jgi:dATP pyrophosphohydrolase
MQYKNPQSVLVLIHDTQLNVLLLKRAKEPVFWQSVTGSVESGESLHGAALRECFEETGLVAQSLRDWQMQHTYAIYPEYLHLYAPGVTHNTEHVFSLCIPRHSLIILSPREHTECQWLPWQEASRACRSWSNQAVIDQLPLQGQLTMASR